ncbi:MAG: hypothetical protein HY729_13465 [Candidatus Rokubacteria bacterium]|nr:hypothetical protein [Candidatus Rokubacteria bacterium]
MRAKILLADSAEVREGLLFLLGGGWTEVGPASQMFAIAGILDVEWDETNAQHSAEFTIEEEDGAPLMVPTPTGDQPFKIVTRFEVGRPPGSPRGRSFNVPVAIPILPIPWTPGRRYVLMLRIDETEVDRLRFSVRATPPQPQPRL